MKLGYQDKLALSMTSAESQRRLASIIGCSHQQLGRWLREGQPAIIDPTTGYLIRQKGAVKIPEAFHVAIDFAFALHKEVTRQQARTDKLPYISGIPVFAFRGVMKTGVKGDRVIAPHTHYMKSDLRNAYMFSMQQTDLFYNATLRSTINIQSYIGASAKVEAPKRRMSPKTYAKMNLNEFMEGRLNAENYDVPMFTKMEYFGADYTRAVSVINKKMAEKYEPHAVHIADQIRFQLYPAKYEKPKARSKTKAQSLKRR